LILRPTGEPELDLDLDLDLEPEAELDPERILLAFLVLTGEPELDRERDLETILTGDLLSRFLNFFLPR